ncbi:MAG TPA: DUF3147 family protein [Vicinamibacterales bacterium]|jgi:hypothetical protein|nr:DUF3147 family protein [Vicinamibacterales bacterium]
MKIRADTSTLYRTKWYEYAVRFLFGGVMTGAAGLIARIYGPGVGGLFLAFPAIFPASATLIDKHEREKKQRAGLRPGHRGRDAAALDAAGAAMGAFGMFVFALIVWQFLSRADASLVLVASTLAWFVVSVLVWRIEQEL